MSFSETNIEVDKSYVEKRVKDWEKRVNAFYKEIGQWLKGTEYEIRISPNIKFELYEELMARFLLKPVKLDIATIYKGSQFVGKIAPFGLWIIGANGSLELNTGIRSHKIVDVSSPFTKPIWKIVVRKGFSEELKPLNKTALLSILHAEDIRIR